MKQNYQSAEGATQIDKKAYKCMQSRSMTNTTSTKRKKLVLAVIGFFIMSLTPTFFWLATQAHEANKAFAVFCDALVSKNYEQAYALTSSEFQATMTEAAFANQQATLCSNLGELKQIKRGTFETERHEDGWSSNIDARFEFSRAERSFNFKMKKERGEWQVFGYAER